MIVVMVSKESWTRREACWAYMYSSMASAVVCSRKIVRLLSLGSRDTTECGE